MRITRLLLALLLLSTVASAQDATVNFSDTKQRIEWIGGHDRNVTTLTDAQADQFFGTGPTGIGLSALLGGIEPTGAPSSAYSNMTKAAQRGARIIARPWTAGAARKDNGQDANGGHLLAGKYGEWSDVLAGFQATILANAGVTLYALGVQNEADFNAPYDSTQFTTTEMVNFLKVLGPKVKALSPAPLIVLPETSGWDLSQAYATAVLADGTAAPYLDRGGAHQYSGTPALVATGKPTWMTEMSYFDAYAGTIGQALTVAADLHAAFVTGNVSGWAWWELIQQTGATDNEGLTGDGTDSTAIPKRFYVLGNYSKYIRPEAFRAGVSGGPSGVSISAYRNKGNSSVVVVAINTSGSTQSFNITLTGLSPATLTPYVTSATQNLAALTPITGSSNVFAVSLANNTVTTFVGTVAVPARLRKLRFR